MSFPRNSRCAPNPRRTERGSAIITALIFAAITAVIASGFLFRASQEVKLATRASYLPVALNLAEAGIEEGLYAVNSSTLNAGNGWALASGSTTDYVKTISSGLDFGQGTGSIHVRIDAAASNSPVIVAAGVVTFPGQPKIVKQLRVSSSRSSSSSSSTATQIWSSVIVSKSNFNLSGSAKIDSYDSTRGDWNAATNRSDRAAVSTFGNVGLTGASEVYGYVATSGATPTVTGSSKIYGATSPSGGNAYIDPTRVRKDFATTVPDVSAPTGTSISLGNYSIGGVTAAKLPRAGDNPGPNGRYVYTCSALSVGGSGSLTIAGPVDIIVTGNSSVSGAGYIAVGGGTSVNPSFNLYCPGSISIGGSGLVNNTSVPSKSSIWGTKASSGSAQTITLSGASGYKGTVYAPNGDVNISGSAGLSGAVIGKSVTLSGAAQIHYDVQLLTTAPTGGSASSSSGGASTSYLNVTSWSELNKAPGSGAAFSRDNRAPFNALF